MSRVQFTVQAGRDLEEIEEFISLDNPDAAARLLLSIHEKCALLSRQPQMAEVVLICHRSCADFRWAIIWFFIALLRMELKSSVFFTARGIFLNCLIDFFEFRRFVFNHRASSIADFHQFSRDTRPENKPAPPPRSPPARPRTAAIAFPPVARTR